MLPYQSGPLRLPKSGGHHGQVVVPMKMAGTKSNLGIQYILRRNSVERALQ
jgi:hypothetical protein